MKSAQITVPMYHNSSARLVLPHDTMLVDDAYRVGGDGGGSGGSIMGTLGGLNNKEIHYTFQPSKQIVSISTLCFMFFLP